MRAPARVAATARLLGRFCADQGGATAIEYGMIAAGIGAFIAATIWTLGGDIKTGFYDKVADIFK